MSRFDQPAPELPPTAGAIATFEEVVLPHLDSAYGLARWLVRDPTLAEDVVQDAACRALGYFGSFKSGDGRAWLMKIVRNVAYGALAARQRTLGLMPDDRSSLESETVQTVPDPGDDPEMALTRCQDLSLLSSAVSGLPIELRECLVLRELEEMSYREIAEITGIPIGTVMSRLWRARQALALRMRREIAP